LIEYYCDEQEPSICNLLCGNGVNDTNLVYIEECDDSNINSGDGCSSTCYIEIGYECLEFNQPCATICGDGMVVG